MDSLISCFTASHSLTGCCRLVETPYYRQADEFSGIFLGKSQGLYWQRFAGTSGGDHFQERPRPRASKATFFSSLGEKTGEGHR